MDSTQPRIILVDVSDESRDVMVRRLNAQGYIVEPAADAAMGADLALTAPPAVVVADLWMPAISGVQLCRLLRAEPATADVPVILRGETDDPRSRFWAERAGAVAYVRKGRMGELVRLLAKAVAHSPVAEGFFMQLSGGTMDIRDRIAKHLDAALFDSVIAAEVRALSTCGSFDRLFDLFSQFLSQVLNYRWLAVYTTKPEHFAVHCHPHLHAMAEREAREALSVPVTTPALRVLDEDAGADEEAVPPVVCSIPFGNLHLGQLALSPTSESELGVMSLLNLVAREFSGPVRIAALMDESQRLAAIDPLTGLMNRRSFLAKLNDESTRAARLGTPLSALLMDVDHFKLINDRYGHAAGDQVLSALGVLLRKELRGADLAARWGGEEFVVALINSGPEESRIVGERLRSAVEQLVVNYEETRIPVTASVGLATARLADTLESLIDRADRAMYAAKVQGRNRLISEDEKELPLDNHPRQLRSA